MPTRQTRGTRSAKQLLFFVASAFATGTAHATTALDLSRFSVSGIYELDRLGSAQWGFVSGLEASGVAHAHDRFDAQGNRGTLFYVGDASTGVVEISRTGQTLGTMAFNWTGSPSSRLDVEGLTYLGDGVLVLADERAENLYRFDYSAGATLALGSTP